LGGGAARNPGKNVTGLGITPTPEIEAKRLELLNTILPHSKRVAFLGMNTDWEDPYGKSVQGGQGNSELC
jgi:hypothetical protein